MVAYVQNAETNDHVENNDHHNESYNSNDGLTFSPHRVYHEPHLHSIHEVERVDEEVLKNWTTHQLDYEREVVSSTTNYQ